MAKVEIRNRPKSLRCVRSVAPKGAERFLLAHFVLRIAAKFMLGALLKPLFGQFLEGAFSEVRLACMGRRRFCGKSIMGSGERVGPLPRSGSKEYASCPMRTRRTTRTTPVVGRVT